MLNLNYELLKLFQVVMTESSLADSAKKLGVTPSAVSQGLKKLETELGVQLFLREHKKLVMTSKGKEIQEKLFPTLIELETKLIDLIDQNQDSEPTGSMIVGAPYELGSTFLIEAFGSFRKKYPKVKAQIKVASPTKLLELVAKGEIDFALCADGVHFKNLSPNFSRKKLFDEELVVLAPKEWNLKAEYQEMVKRPHLDYATDGSAVGMWYQLHFKKSPKNLEVALVAENAFSIIEGVKAGIGMAMLPLQRIQNYLDDSVSMVQPTSKKFLNPIVLIQHIDRIPSLTEKKFIEQISQIYP